MAVSPAPCHPETPPRPGKPVTTRDWVTGAIRLRSTLESLPVEELIPKSLKCCRMAKEETPSISKDLQELWRKLSLLIDSVQNNSKVVAFMKSPVGQYLDKHPFVALTLLVFVVVSAVPVGFFLLLVVLTSLAAFVGVILLEGLVISVGGLSLFCVLCGLGFVSLAISGTIIVCYVVVSSLINHWFSSGPLIPDSSGDCQLTVKPAGLEGRYQE
ncbi:lipid droplet assembly factor 1 isoform X5 [Molossus molossus]|uniref:Transmembrane protein 159 n=2 Tax=Molossus molossus TaxID=27622 RepID=A0A7J8J370_MOLMO|nr:lipid droplet assembly factor 1 isoform X5 [Molossus molossus]KAF6491273.1 transmembrane protein 159 [Molossus molossus]